MKNTHQTHTETGHSNKTLLGTGVGLAMSLLACIGVPESGQEQGQGPTVTEFEPGEPSYLDALMRPSRSNTTAMSPCQALGYPCRLADVSEDALEREHTIDMLVFEAIERGDRSNQIVEALEGTEGLEWIRATSNSEVSYKVQGSIPKLAILEGFRRDDLGSVGGLMPSLDTQDPTQTTRRARLVVDEPLHARTLKLASMAEWESGLTLGSLGGKANPNLGLVGQAIGDAPSYDLERVDALHISGAITSRTPGAAWLDGFRDWRNYPYVIVHAHGTIQDLNEELNKGHLFTLTTDFPPTLEGARECAKYIQSTVYGLDVIPGLVCIPFKKSYDIGVTMDTLYAMNSAPLEDTIITPTSCRFGQNERQASLMGSEADSVWLLEGGSQGVGWDGLVKARDADIALSELTRLMLVDGLRVSDALERVETKTSMSTETDDEGKEVPVTVKLVMRGESPDARARHVVFFADENGRAIDPEDTNLLEVGKEDERGWVAPMLVLYSGVLPEEVGMFPTEAAAATDSDVGVFEPSPFNPSSPGARKGPGEYDYLVPVEVIFGQEGPKHGERVNFRVDTKLPEGGSSGIGGLSPSIGAMLESGESEGYASFVIARPDCAIANMTLGAGPGAGSYNMNFVTTRENILPGVFTIRGSVARRNLDEDLVDELPPDFGVTITGALPNTGETKTYGNEELMFTASTSASNPFAVYVVGEFGDGFQGNVTLTLTRRDNGTYKGTLRGMAAYPDQNAEDDFSDAPLDVVFLAGPVGDEDETFQCF